MASDGERYVAYVPDPDVPGPGTIRVRDTKTRLMRDIETECVPEAGGAGHVLLSCGYEVSNRPAILDPRTLHIRMLAPRSDLTYVAIGRWWLAATSLGLVCSSCQDRFTYINWHTGQARTAAGNRNLDSRRLRPEPDPPRGFAVYARFGRGVIYQRDALFGRGRLEARDSRGTITRLSSCRPACVQIDPSAGKVTWLQFRGPEPDPRLRSVFSGYDAVTHRRYRWPIRVAPSLAEALDLSGDVVHTRYEAVVSTLRADYGIGGGVSYAVAAMRWKRR